MSQEKTQDNPIAPIAQEFLHNSRDILTQIFKSRISKTSPTREDIGHTIDLQSTREQLASLLKGKPPTPSERTVSSEPSPTETEDDFPDFPTISGDAQYDGKYLEVDNIWTRLRDCSTGEGSLSPEDATEILLLLSSLINSDLMKSHEEIAESIFQSIGQEDLKTLDEEFLRYLTSHYAQLGHVAVSSEDFEDKASKCEDEIDTDFDIDRIGSDEDVQLAEKLRLSSEVVQLLGHLREWEFDVFKLESLTAYPLVAVTEAALGELHLPWRLDLNLTKLRRFLVAIHESYQQQPYHNSLHGADVAQTMFHMCTQCRLVESLAINELATCAILLSGAIHDVGHPGVTNKFMVAVCHPLAVQYNDNSPLENMHLATAFRLWLLPQNNFTERMSKNLFRDMRRLIIEMVLFTDNDKHFVLMDKVESLLNSGDLSFLSPAAAAVANARKTPTSGLSAESTAALRNSTNLRRSQSDFRIVNVVPPYLGKQASSDSSLPPSSPSPLQAKGAKTSVSPAGSNTPATKSLSVLPTTPVTPTQAISAVTEPRQLLLLQLALHAADVSNPVKPWTLHMRWYPRLLEEFYHQGDEERELGLPITFAFDRLNPVAQPKFQLGFLKAIVSPLYKTYARIPGMNLGHCLQSLDTNIKNWELLMQYDESGDKMRTPSEVYAAAQAIVTPQSQRHTDGARVPVIDSIGLPPPPASLCAVVKPQSIPPAGGDSSKEGEEEVGSPVGSPVRTRQVTF